MSEPLIRCHDVDFAYAAHPEGTRPVLCRCNFRLDPGGRVALVGPNGSGKTTLLHLVVGLLRPTSGQVEAFGKLRQSEADFHEVRCRAGLLFQEADDQLFCPTVAEDVAFGPLNLGKPRDEVRQIVAQTLQSVGLGGYEERITHQLSTGEKRLVALATVLAMQPEVLLLDEPAAGLDEPSTERLVQLLVGLPQAMVVVSHDRDFLRKTTSSTLRLRDGGLEPVEGGN
jgi:cobalt/nickel transport system ATP-binding protein